MSDLLKIRKAVESDAPIISRITKKAFEEYAKLLPELPDALTETEDDIENDIVNKMVFVAELNRNIIGTVRLTPDGEKMYLSRFAVKPDQQGSGIGKHILEYCDIMAKISGAKEIYLHTSTDAENLMTLYNNCGYELNSINTDKGYNRATLIKKLI